MDFISLNKDNIATEHICCAISPKKGETGVDDKKTWLTERFDDGLVFLKANVQGKVFIEYIPAENAWNPIEAEGYHFINCFWVSGRFKGEGYGKALLKKCIEDSKTKGKKGLVIVSSDKKRPFLCDPGFLKSQGFQIADKALFYELLYLPFEKDAPVPTFKDCVKSGKIEDKGMVLYYTCQCPHTEKYAQVIAKIAKEQGKELKLRKLTTKEEAQNAPCVFTTYSLFDKGEFLTNEILSGTKFTKYLLEGKKP